MAMRKVLRDLHWDREAWRDYKQWQKEDSRQADKIDKMIDECLGDNPFVGTGQPECLKKDLAGYWSRRIIGKHRFVYDVTDKAIYVLMCKEHYND